MKRIFKLLAITFLLNLSLNATNEINLTPTEKTWIQDNTISIGVEQWRPVVFSNNGTDVDGIAGDTLKLIIKKLNLKTVVVNDKWDILLTDFRNKKIDLLPATYFTKERATYGLYSKPYFNMKEYIFIKSNNNSIKDFKDLNGKKLAIIKGYGTIPKIKEKFPDITIVQTKDLEESIYFVLEGKVDALVDAQIGVLDFLQQNLIGGIKSISQHSFDASPMYLFSHIDKPILQTILQKGLDSITLAEKNTILSRWLQEDHNNSNNNLSLTNKEKEYLTKNRIIKMCNNPSWEPIEFPKNNDMNQMSGIAIDTLHIIEERLNVKFQNVPTTSWSQSQQFLKEKKCDILPCAIATDKRKKYAIFTKPYLKLPLAVFTTKDKSVISSLDQIMDQTWSRQQGSGLISKMRKEYPNTKIVETKSDEEALQFVNSGKVYFTIATLPVASNVISKYQLNDLHIAGYSDIIYKLSMAIRDDKPMLRDILDKTLKNITKDEKKNIFKNWVGTTIKEVTTDYTLLFQIIGVILLILLFLIYRQTMLKKANKDLKDAVKEKTHELQDINDSLEQRIIEEVEKNVTKEKQLFEASKMSSMGEMIANIAHQWRQPLSIISTATTGMQLQKELNILSDEKFEENCNTIVKNVNHLSNTIEIFRNYLEDKKELKKVVIQDRIDVALEIVHPSLKSNQIKLKNNINYEEKIESTIIVGELSQVIINIINNAKDVLVLHKIKNPIIIISLDIIIKEDIKYICIAIEDNGKGIPDDVMPKIFEPYFTTKHKSQGTGLGLHMSYKIVHESLNGSLYAININDGAKFFIEFPLINNIIGNQ